MVAYVLYKDESFFIGLSPKSGCAVLSNYLKMLGFIQHRLGVDKKQNGFPHLDVLIVRCPFQRLLSGYLDICVKRRSCICNGQSPIVNSFSVFVTQLCAYVRDNGWDAVNIHFHPQSKNLPADVRRIISLSAVTNLVPHPDQYRAKLDEFSYHHHKYQYEDYNDPNIAANIDYVTYPQSIYPKWQAFYTSGISNLVKTLYSADFKLYERCDDDDNRPLFKI